MQGISPLNANNTHLAPALWCIPQAQALDAARTSTLDTRLLEIAKAHARVVQMSSLAVEDMVITEAIARLNLPFTIAVLDTGRLNPETLDLIAETEKRFGRKIVVHHPDAAAVQALIAEQGEYGFYQSLENRRACCAVRKSVPLENALQGFEAWLTGQRREQSLTRSELPFAESDSKHGLAKFNPIFDFSESDVWALAHARDVPLNALYHQGYPSIGCAPCTKPVRASEDIRAGRWWWENAQSKECGLHK